MDRQIQLLNEEYKVILSSQIIEKMRYIARGNLHLSNQCEYFTNEINIMEYYRIMSDIMDIPIFLPSKDNSIKYDTGLIYSLSQHLEQLRLQYKGKIRKMDESTLSDLINTVYKIKIEIRNYDLTFDLMKAKNDCLASMKYFVSEENISLFNDEYDKAIQTKDINKMKNMLKSAQQAILQEWDNYFAKMDSMNDDNFTFIGHSVRSPEFNGEFCSRYVSASLFNQDLTDTYQEGYGFILAPKNIVGACSQDMYVNNDAQDSELLLHYSIIQKIDHPKRIIDECLSLKKQNIEDGNEKKVYSEIVLDGFEPIGIFCFTDGSKNLNHNYRAAKELQERFPNLKIRSFDIMKRKKGTELVKVKLSLVNNLRKRFDSDSLDIDVGRLSMYDYFLEEYEKLKQTKNFNEEQIETIFKKNRELLDLFYKEPDYLFDGRYDEKEIKYILEKNNNYNIGLILSGKASSYTLNNLKQLYPYKDKLNSMYDGLSEFVELVSRVKVTDDMMLDINSSETINFYTIAKIIVSKRMNSINSKEEQSKQELNDYQSQYNDLYKEVQERENIQKKYDYYDQIYMNRFFSEKIKEDYTGLVDDISNNEYKSEKLQAELKEITESITSLENSIGDDSGLKKTNKRFNLFELFKHSIFYKLKRSKEKNELILKKNALETKKRLIEQNLNFVQLDQQNLYEQFTTIKSQLYNYFKCDSIDEIDVSIEKAEEFKRQYDNGNVEILIGLKMRLKELANMILEQQNKLEGLLEEKEIISRSM